MLLGATVSHALCSLTPPATVLLQLGSEEKSFPRCSLRLVPGTSETRSTRTKCGHQHLRYLLLCTEGTPEASESVTVIAHPLSCVLCAGQSQVLQASQPAFFFHHQPLCQADTIITSFLDGKTEAQRG